MTISREGVDLIKKYEGFSSKPYLCPARIPTIGYGTTVYHNGKKVTLNDPAITEAEATFLLSTMIDRQYGKAVNDLVKYKITQGMFDALVSFTYNVGVGNLQVSTLLKKVNAGKFKEAGAEFMKWNKASGKVLKGLTDRRIAERTLFEKGIV